MKKLEGPQFFSHRYDFFRFLEVKVWRDNKREPVLQCAHDNHTAFLCTASSKLITNLNHGIHASSCTLHKVIHQWQSDINSLHVFFVFYHTPYNVCGSQVHAAMIVSGVHVLGCTRGGQCWFTFSFHQYRLKLHCNGVMLVHVLQKSNFLQEPCPAAMTTSSTDSPGFICSQLRLFYPQASLIH